MKRVTALIVLLSCGFIGATEQEYPIEEGFVAYANEPYMPYLEYLLKSVHAFSTRPIVVFGINTDIPFSQEQYPRMIKKRIDVDLNDFHIYYQKSRIVYESGIKYGVYLEADDIVNATIDELFQASHRVQNYPLCPLRLDLPHIIQQEPIPTLMKMLNIATNSMPYVRGHVVFSHKCREFIKDWMETCYKCKDIASASNYDTTVLNLVLWKHNAKEYLPPYDPYFTAISDYIKGTADPRYTYYTFHGAKDPAILRDVLKTLLEYHSVDYPL